MVKLVFARHGESEWNKANLFTGWADVDLSEKGTQQAIDAGKLIKEAGIEFDKAYTSVLKRAIKTTNLALEASDQLWVPVEKSWRLNERHYGGLTGKNKAEAAEQFGDEQVHIWRRSYDVLPPKMDRDDEYSAHKDRRYASLDDSVIPDAENLKVTLERALPFWEDKIAPALKDGKNVYKAKDVDEFERKIRLFFDGKLKSLASNAYKIAEERDLKNIGNKLKNIYEEVMHSSK